MNEALIKEFDSKMHQLYERISRDCNYSATRFKKLLNSDGGYKTAQKLLVDSHQNSDGFVKLLENNCLNLSMECLVQQEPWCQLFTESELKVAKNRTQKGKVSWCDGTL